MPNKKLSIFLPLCFLVIVSLACSVLPGGGSTSGLQATANAAFTQAAAAASTAGAQGSSLQATAEAASTQAVATANAAGADQPTAAATTAGSSSSGPQDIPLIDPHTVVSASDAELTYNTTADIPTVVKFYQDQMPKLGWTVEGSPYVTANIAKMGFTKSGKIVTIGMSIDPKTKQTVVGALVE